MNPSRLIRVAALDFRHNLKRPLFWMFIATILFIVWMLAIGDMRISSGDSTVGGTKAWLTSEFAVAQTLTFVVFLFYVFFIAVAAGMSIINDDNLKVGEILHSTPLRPSEYFLGKFIAVFGTFVAILGLHLVLAMFFNHLFPTAVADEVRGPFALINYLRPGLLIALPTVWFFTATSFAVGAWTRNPILIFVLPVALVMGTSFFLWDWSPTWLDPRVNQFLMVADVSGFRWINETWIRVDRGVDFYNTSPLSFDGIFWLNRLLLILGGLAALALSLAHFARKLRGDEVSVKTVRQAREAGAGAVSAAGVIAPAGAAGMGAAGEPPGLLRGAVIVARAEFKELRSQPGLYLFVPLILIQIIAMSFLDTGAFDTPVLSTAGVLAVQMMNTLTLTICLLLLFYTVESFERESKNGFDSIFLATPIRTASSFLGKGLANGTVALVILLAALVACLLVLLFQGRTPADPMPFALIWGVLLIPTFIVWMSFVMAVYALFRNRYTTYAVALAVLIFTGWKVTVGEMNWVGNWNLWSVLQWSDMGIFEIDRVALLLNRVMVLGLATFFIAVALSLYARAERDVSRTGARIQPGALVQGALRVSPYLLVPLAAGIALFVQVQAGYQGRPAEKKMKDYWRRNLATWHDALYPSLTDVEADLQLDPARRWFRVEGRYTLVNREEETLRQVPLTRGLFWEDMKWSVNGEEAEPEDRVGLLVFHLDPPLTPGDSLQLGFSYESRFPKGITKNGGGAREFILPSGVVLTAFTPSFLPLVGYSEEIGIDDENRYESREYPEDFYEGVTDPAIGGGDRVTTSIRITGPQEYTYNSVGTLRSEEVTDGQRTVVWKSDYPVYFFNVVAGKWSVKEGERTKIYYHPSHDYNVDEISEALEASLRYYSEWFAPYPWQELKLSEFPALARYAQGFPTNITFSEGLGFLTKDNPRANAAFLVTAHEAAHQWWGNLLLPGEGPGGNILSEGTAHFSTILLFDQVKGLRQRIEFCKGIEDNYGNSRRVDSERPLVQIDGSKEGDETVTYDKGGWVFWMLLNQMGRDRALAGMRSFIEQYHAGPDFPVLQDFVAAMRPFAADSTAYDEFVGQWFFDVVVPQYRITDAESAESEDGWRVTATVTNIGTGVMPVEIAVSRGERFPEVKEEKEESGPDSEEPPRATELARTGGSDTKSEFYEDARTTIELAAGESETVTIRCPFKPERIQVDPDALVLQLNRDQAIADF